MIRLTILRKSHYFHFFLSVVDFNNSHIWPRLNDFTSLTDSKIPIQCKLNRTLCILIIIIIIAAMRFDSSTNPHNGMSLCARDTINIGEGDEILWAYVIWQSTTATTSTASAATPTSATPPPASPSPSSIRYPYIARSFLQIG